MYTIVTLLCVVTFKIECYNIISNKIIHKYEGQRQFSHHIKKYIFGIDIKTKYAYVILFVTHNIIINIFFLYRKLTSEYMYMYYIYYQIIISHFIGNC